MRACYYCGTENKPEDIVVYVHVDHDARGHYVVCENCGARGPSRNTDDLALRIWEYRSTDDSMRVIKQALYAANKHIHKQETKEGHALLEGNMVRNAYDLVMTFISEIPKDE
jgi:hypothetical protein